MMTMTTINPIALLADLLIAVKATLRTMGALHNTQHLIKKYKELQLTLTSPRPRAQAYPLWKLRDNLRARTIHLKYYKVQHPLS